LGLTRSLLAYQCCPLPKKNQILLHLTRKFLGIVRLHWNLLALLSHRLVSIHQPQDLLKVRLLGFRYSELGFLHRDWLVATWCRALWCQLALRWRGWVSRFRCA